MAHALEHEERFRVALHHEDGVGLGHVGLDFLGSSGDVVWNSSGTRCLVMDGELYDTAALKESVSRDGRQPAPRSDAELLLRLYDKVGEGVFSRLNGAFVAALWDRPSRRLLIVNDRLGLFPLYYSRVNGDLLFGSGVRALLADAAVSRAVDRVAINQFLVFDHMLDDRTLLEGVRVLPQGAILAFQDGRFSLRRYWTPRYPECYEPQPEGAYVEQFVHHLRRAIVRQQADSRPAAVLLSGGLDSRLLLAPLAEQVSALETVTFGIRGCDDAVVAQEVASAVGTKHSFFELKPDWLREHADEGVRVTDGLANVVNLHVLATRDQQARHAQVLYKGFMGDALLGFALKPQMWADYAPADRYDVHLGVHRSQGVVNYTPEQQRALFTECFRTRVGDGVLQAYRDGMDRAGVSQLANQRLFFDLTQRVPRMTLNGVAAARTRALVRLPFCDNDLVDFALTVPPGFLFERRLPKEALVQYFPRLAQIPVASTGRPLTSCARDLFIQAKELASWHLRRRGLGMFAARPRRPYKDYDTWLRTVLRPWMEGILLQPRALERGYFQPDYVRTLVAEHAGGARHAVRLGALLTLELWHRRFVD